MKQNIIYKIILFLTIFNLTIFADVTVDGTIQTSYFLNSPISGVQYKCDNGTLKTTGTDGSFSYDNSCSNITFSLNNKVILGTILKEKVANLSDGKLYITDFAGSSRTDTNNKYVRNIAVLLQSLDTDETPENGLSIVTSSITTSVTITKDTTIGTLQTILNQQYPSRTLVSEICAIVHLENVLKDSGLNIDTVPPCKPKLAFDVLATSNDKTYIELVGERNSSIYLNNVDTLLKLDSNGKYYDFELNTTIERNTFDTFIITYKDYHSTTATPYSDPLTLRIFNDTDQPFITNIPTDNNITVTHPSTTVFTFIATDDTISNNIPVSYEILGTDKDLFTITLSGNANGVLTFKSPSTAGTYRITVKVIDKANHYDTSDLNIIVN